jgi:hypothetical protein
MLVRTDYTLRMHLFVDPEASVLDAFRVELGGLQSVLVHRAQATPAELWREVLETISFLRAQNNQYPVYSPAVFAPFAFVTACEARRESMKTGLRTAMIVGAPGDGDRLLGPEPDPGRHMEKVQALCRAIDILDELSPRARMQ